MNADTYRPSTELLRLQAELDRRCRRKDGPVDGLLDQLLDWRNLEAAWERVRSNRGARTPGQDGLTCREIEVRASAWLEGLAKELRSGRYRASAARTVEIPKHPGSSETRQIGILNVKDRVVHAALKQVLEPLLEPVFLDTSFGFRPGRSVAGALTTATQALTRAAGDGVPFSAAIHLDVTDCFPSIDHGLLLGSLKRHVSDENLLCIIRSILDAGGQATGLPWKRRNRGLVQGSGLSPLLCNLVLHSVDEALWQATRSTPAVAYRYADDLWLAGADARTLKSLIGLVRRELRRLRLDLRAPVGTPVKLTDGVEWLGVTIREHQAAWADVPVYCFEVPGRKVRRLFDVIDEMTVPPSDRLGKDAFNLSGWIISLNEQLRQWREAYMFAANGAEVFRSIDERARKRVAELLRHLTGQSWRGIYEQHRCWLPRGFWTWEADGARLVCLSSLAPRNPNRLVKRPLWQRLRAVGSNRIPAGATP